MCSRSQPPAAITQLSLQQLGRPLIALVLIEAELVSNC